jgi:UDP-GlcNAc3NAcA epimerase
MLKILTVIGARPQFIKAAALSGELANDPDLNEVIVNTGQHYDKDMSEVFFAELGIPEPKYNLNIHGLSHGVMTGRMLESLEKVCLNEEPDWVLLYGDTNSTLAGALAASKLNIPIVHVEAGLRSNNLSMPEEVNRIVTDRLSSLLLCPTALAEENLTREGFPLPCTASSGQRIVNVGDIMFDAVKKFSNKEVGELTKKVISRANGKFALATIHRPSNTDCKETLQEIFDAFSTISKTLKIILPIHPRTRKKIIDFDITFDRENIIVIDPAPYGALQHLISRAEFVMTDSGGLQKEAYFHRKKCITLRDETEWVETISSGWNTLTGSSFENILKAVDNVGTRPDEYVNFYGSGDTAKKIIAELKLNA